MVEQFDMTVLDSVISLAPYGDSIPHFSRYSLSDGLKMYGFTLSSTEKKIRKVLLKLVKKFQNTPNQPFNENTIKIHIVNTGIYFYKWNGKSFDIVVDEGEPINQLYNHCDPESPDFCKKLYTLLHDTIKLTFLLN
jgi:hypothetical protein